MYQEIFFGLNYAAQGMKFSISPFQTVGDLAG